MKIKNTILTLVATLLFTASAHAATFDVNGFGKEWGGWKKKDKTAAEYKSAGSNYRTYKPTVSPTPDGGVLVSTKIDHIQGWAKDDHCQLEMTFDKNGEIVSSSAKITMGKKKVFDTQIVTASAALVGASAGTTAVIALGAAVTNKLQDQIAKWNDGGGRANFPAVVKHNFNLIAKHVKK